MPPRPLLRPAAALPTLSSSSSSLTKAYHGSDNEPAALTLPQLFYDSGSGYSPRECLTVAEDAYDELTHEVSAVFTLPTDARALRLDPGELACCVTDLSISDERLECRAMNGIQLQEDCLLFLDVDPNLTVQSTVPFAAGMKFAVTYHYYPLSAIKLRAEAEQNDLRGQLQAALAENTRLNNQLTELQNSRAAYENSLENLYESSSWRLTAPLRALHRLFRH